MINQVRGLLVRDCLEADSIEDVQVMDDVRGLALLRRGFQLSPVDFQEFPMELVEHLLSEDLLQLAGWKLNVHLHAGRVG